MKMSTKAIAGVLIVGSGGLLVPGLQPLLLDAAMKAGRADNALAGLIATAEMVAMGVTAAFAGKLLQWLQPRQVALFGLMLSALFDLASGYCAGLGLLAIRSLAGLAEGMLIAVAIVFIAKSDRPARWSGIFLSAQTASQCLAATALGYIAVPLGGVTGAFIGLGLIMLLMVLIVPALPFSLPRATGLAEHAIEPLARSAVIGLIGMATFLSATVGLWVFLAAIAGARGLSEGAVSAMIPLVLAAQVCGGLLASRIDPPRAGLAWIVKISAIGVVIFGALYQSHIVLFFITFAVMLGFFWLFSIPILVAVLARLEGGASALMLVGAAQLTGSALGPLLTGTVATLLGLDAVILTATALLLLACLLFTVAIAMSARRTIVV